MDKKLIAKIEGKVDLVWETLIECGHTRLVRINPPAIIFNNRFYRCAGRSHQQERIVELGSKFFGAYANEMLRVIVPHEVIHQADFDLFGFSDKKCGHGTNWRMLMLQYGLPDDKFHSLHIDARGNKL